MQVFWRVIQPVAINVVDDLTRFRVGDLSVFPLLSVVPFCPGGSDALRFSCLLMRPICLFRRFIAWFGGRQKGCIANNFVSATHVFARRQAADLFLVGVERVTVELPHLVVPHAHFAGSDRSIAVGALPPNNFPAPFVFGCAVLLGAPVVHQAKVMCRMFSSAAINTAKSLVFAGVVHSVKKLVITSCIVRYKAMGNKRAISTPSRGRLK